MGLYAQFYVLAFCFCLARSGSNTSSDFQPIFDASPKKLETGIPVVNMLCKVKPMPPNMTYIFIGISKLRGNKKIYVAKLGRNNTVQRECLGRKSEVVGTLTNRFGGYLLIRINKPRRLNEGRYVCESHFKASNKEIYDENSKIINIKYKRCCMKTAELFGALNIQHDIFVTINEHDRKIKVEKLQNRKKEIKQISKQLDKILDFNRQLDAIDKNLNDSQETSKNIMGMATKLNGSALSFQIDSDRQSDMSGYSLYRHLNKTMVPESAGFARKVTILRRVSGSVDFSRTYSEYEEGFGDMDGNFWLGLKKMHEVTKYLKNLEVKLITSKGPYMMHYRRFEVGDYLSGYKLNVEQVPKGNTKLIYNDDMKFSAIDRDQDRTQGKCATNSGWWYKSCSYVRPTGIYGSTIYWQSTSGKIVFIEFSLCA